MWSICCSTGWFCLSDRTLVISRRKAVGSSTNACASGRGLSKTMAISISLPSSWISAGRPSCICSKIATALFSQIFPYSPLHQGRILRWDTTLPWLSQLSQKGAFGRGGWREGRKFCDYASDILLCYVVRARCLMADVRFRADRLHVLAVPHRVVGPLRCFTVDFDGVSLHVIFF